MPLTDNNPQPDTLQEPSAMPSTLIADAGSTKIDWAFISPDGRCHRFSTSGLNALMASPQEIESILEEARENLTSETPQRVEYYGAGCATPEICSRVADAIQACFGTKDVEVASDLLGAARSLFGNRPGIACILGTGSNSCMYDGVKIAEQIPSLGFILGDEGSGASLGKRLVADAFKGHLPEEITRKLKATYNLDLPSLLERVYRQPGANRWLASLVPFMQEHLWNPYIFSLVHKEMRRFVRRNVVMYRGAHSLPISVTGSIAFAFEPILRKAAEEQGLEIAEITKSPIEGLIKNALSNRKTL